MSKLNKINIQRPIASQGRGGYVPTIEFARWIQSVEDRLGIADENKVETAQVTAEEAGGAAIAPATPTEAGRVMQAAAVEDLAVSANSFTKTSSASTAPTAAAPATYDQAQIDGLRAAIQDLQSKQALVVNDIDAVKTTTDELITGVEAIESKTNEIITADRDAGQMAIP